MKPHPRKHTDAATHPILHQHSPSIAELKARLDLATLVSETHAIDARDNVLCPFHDDHHPSLHLYPGAFHCFACGAHGDHLDWLQHVHHLDLRGAIAELRRRAGLHPPPTQRNQKEPDIPKPRLKDPWGSTTPIPDHLERDYYDRLQQQLDDPEGAALPAALLGRGFTLADRGTLFFLADGDDALFPILDPEGRICAIKRRYATPTRPGHRYDYPVGGKGSPPWVSPCAQYQDELLIVEGELNAMIAWLILGRTMGVIGLAGSNGKLYRNLVRGRSVTLYTDGDEAGARTRENLSFALRSAHARIDVLEPFEMDFCDIAGTLGLEELRRRLTT